MESTPTMINGKEVDMKSIDIDDVDMNDYPDFSDAYIYTAKFVDGKNLNEEELDILNDICGDLINELAHDSLH